MGESENVPLTTSKSGDTVYSQQLMYRCRMDGGCVVRVDPRCSYESEVVEWEMNDNEWEQEQDPDPYEMDIWANDMLDGSLGHFPSDLRISKHILELVEKFCLDRFEIFLHYYYDDPANDDHSLLLEDKVEEFGFLFVKDKSVTLLVQLMDAAIELSIKNLFVLMRDAIAEKIDLLSAKQIFKIFNLPDDFTHPAWTQSIRSERWDPMQLEL